MCSRWCSPQRPTSSPCETATCIQANIPAPARSDSPMRTESTINSPNRMWRRWGSAGHIQLLRVSNGGGTKVIPTGTDIVILTAETIDSQNSSHGELYSASIGEDVIDA